MICASMSWCLMTTSKTNLFKRHDSHAYMLFFKRTRICFFFLFSFFHKFEFYCYLDNISCIVESHHLSLDLNSKYNFSTKYSTWTKFHHCHFNIKPLWVFEKISVLYHSETICTSKIWQTSTCKLFHRKDHSNLRWFLDFSRWQVLYEIYFSISIWKCCRNFDVMRLTTRRIRYLAPCECHLRLAKRNFD